LSYGNHAGSAGPLREGKGTTFEGGVRVPCVARWPGRIPPGRTTDALAGTIDLLPTIAKLAKAPLPEAKIDGLDVWPVFSGEGGGNSPRSTYYYYWNRELQAVREGKWKLHFPHQFRSLTGTPGRDGAPGGYSQQRIELALYDLAADVGETTNLADREADVVARLQKLADAAREDLGDALAKRSGKNVREPGKLPE
jgi:arylsulfatase A-like enzyme